MLENRIFGENLGSCPRCASVIRQFSMQFDVQEIIGCPDGYVLEHSNFLGHPTMVPKSGKTETYHIAGKANYSVRPCGHYLSKPEWDEFTKRLRERNESL